MGKKTISKSPVCYYSSTIPHDSCAVKCQSQMIVLLHHTRTSVEVIDSFHFLVISNNQIQSIFPRKQLQSKNKKKEIGRKSIQSQRGFLDKFFVKKTNASSEVHVEELENVPEQQIYSEELVEHENELNSELEKMKMTEHGMFLKLKMNDQKLMNLI